MFIEEIELGGFLSYQKRQKVDLKEVTSCLVTGRILDDSDLSNGAGKSSLFEMIPFNFFGKEAGRSDILDDYISWTSDELFTSIIFWMDNRRWKSVRRKKRGSSAVHEIFYDRNSGQGQDEWKLTDKKIETILGLSAKTYSSTIYLNERESLAFINGTGSERKGIFRELLDIDVYEFASKKSSKKAKEYDEKIIVNKRLVEDREEQIQNEKDIKNDLNMTAVLIKGHIETIDKCDKKIDVLIEERKKQEERKEQLTQIRNEVIELSKQYNKLIDELEEIEGEEKEQRAKYEQENEKINDFKKNIEEDILINIEKYTKIIESYDVIENKLSNIKQEIKVKEKEIEEKEKSRDKIRSEIEKEKEKATEYEKEKAKISAEEVQVIKLLTRIEEFGNVCPITETQCSVIDDDYKDDYKRDKVQELDKIKKKSCTIAAELKEIWNKVTGKKINENAFDNGIIVIKDNISELSNMQEELSDKFNKKIDDFKILSDLNNELTTLTEKIKNFEDKQENVNKYFKDVEKDKKDLQKEIDSMDTIIAEKEKEIKKQGAEDIQEECERIDREINGLKKNKDGWQEILTEDKIKASVFEEKLKEIEKTKKYIEKLKETNKKHKKYKQAFLHLAKYFGKDGIQRMLMKNAIPMLEKYSNSLMQEFNDGSDKIKIKFDLDPKTQSGDRKKGGGLEIYVEENEKDLRNLQNYSGGETVRIVFSIIFGLASLLSLRAGKKHETLIIDEKIAKLDKHGIEQFGKIINSISREYKQIFVITHIEELKNILQKDEIVVNKTASGSEVEVIYG